MVQAHVGAVVRSRSQLTIVAVSLAHKLGIQPAIELWNSAAHEAFEAELNQRAGDTRLMTPCAIERWEEKKHWDPDFTWRKKMKESLDQLISGFSVRLGGTTSIDVTKPGIDKAYGIRKLRDTLGVGIDEMIFVGDALFPGGNDYPAKEAGGESIQVRDPEEAKRVAEAIIACLDGTHSARTLESLSHSDSRLVGSA